MVVALASVTIPFHEQAAPELTKAPVELIPEPFRIKPSEVASVKPFRSRHAPDVTDVVPPMAPKGPLVPEPVAPSCNFPALTVVVPV